MKSLTETQYRNVLILLTIPLLVFSKIFQFSFLPEKYFYDSSNILRYMQFMPKYVDGSYRFTVNFFKSINRFGFSSLFEWSIALTVVFGFIIYCVVCKKCRNMNDLKLIYIISTVFLLGVYVFNISKDIIQLLIFFAVAAVVSSKLFVGTGTKLIGVVAIFVFESMIFRSYYVLVALFTVYFYCVFAHMQKMNKKMEAKQILMMLLFTVVVVWGFMLITKIVDDKLYVELMTARSKVNINRLRSADARTAIFDMLPSDGSLWKWILNYVINAVRMMFPLELLTKGIKYIPFVIFQTISLVYLVVGFKKLQYVKNSAFVLSLCVYCAYLLTSFVFEPDFGSWIRHETACFPIFMNIVFCSEKGLDCYERNQYGGNEKN